MFIIILKLFYMFIFVPPKKPKLFYSRLSSILCIYLYPLFVRLQVHITLQLIQNNFVLASMYNGIFLASFSCKHHNLVFFCHSKTAHGGESPIKVDLVGLPYLWKNPKTSFWATCCFIYPDCSLSQ